jgi:hypothetical protein
MRRLALVVLASLTVSTSGCTLAGTGVGALVGAARASANPEAHISVGNHAAVGLLLGLVADAIVIGVVESRLNNSRWGSTSCPTCD